MAERIADDIRAAVIEAARPGVRTFGSIAQEYGISKASVARIVSAAGIEPRPSRLENATRARAADMGRRRAELAAVLLEDAWQLRAQLWQPAKLPMLVSDGGENGSHIEDHPLDRPQFRDQQAIMTATGIALDKHLKLIDRESNPDLVAAGSLLESIGGWMRGQHGNGDSLVGDE